MSDFPEIDQLLNLIVDNWERAFHVEKVGDRELRVYLEIEKESDGDNIWSFLPRQLNKYIVMVIKVPLGYIDVFIRPKSKM